MTLVLIPNVLNIFACTVCSYSECFEHTGLPVGECPNCKKIKSMEEALEKAGKLLGGFYYLVESRAGEDKKRELQECRDLIFDLLKE